MLNPPTTVSNYLLNPACFKYLLSPSWTHLPGESFLDTAMVLCRVLVLKLLGAEALDKLIAFVAAMVMVVVKGLLSSTLNVFG